MEWPKLDHHNPGPHWVNLADVPHICPTPDCPGPKLVAKLEAAETLASWLKYWIPDETMIPAGHGLEWAQAVSAIQAWDSASGVRAGCGRDFSRTPSGSGADPAERSGPPPNQALANTHGNERE